MQTGCRRSCGSTVSPTASSPTTARARRALAITTLDGQVVTLPKNPAGSLYDDLFESAEANATALAASLGCITDSNGMCVAGENDTGNYLVIVRVVFPSINATVYTGNPLGLDDFADTDGDGLGDLANKRFQILVTVERDGRVQFKANSRTVVEQ